MSTWFITGCSTGFGRALAKAVIDRGFNAVISARNVEAIADLAASAPDRTLALALDVTDHAKVVSAVQAAQERFGSIDVLINNAGYGYRSAVEEGERETVETMFATNFYGPVDLIQQVLPGMRERHSGVIVNMSSIAGRMSSPGSGFYSATKFALEGLSDALRQETAQHGIHVILVEPGPFRTDFAGRSMKRAAAISAYTSTVGERHKEDSRIDGNQPGDPAKAAEAIIAVATAAKPPRRLLLGNRAIDRCKEELANQAADIAAWEALGRRTDF
ncbi:MAG: SDR family NAD(P)-dependent oxidoreductase [Propionibacteriaceae bacterium]|nr:SDR family NAD(P)-dependent oxidoreductase [Propionibacteriaceae bacterium]